MKFLRIYVIPVIFILIFAGLSFSQEEPQDFPLLKGPYLGQKPPGIESQIFAPGIITTNLHDDGSPIFTPDGKEVYFRIIAKRDDSYILSLFVMKQLDGIWTFPELSIFTKEYGASAGALSPDGNRFFFKISKHVNDTITPDNSLFWYVERKDMEWSDPIAVGKMVDTPGQEMFPSVSPDGTLYFQVKADTGDPNDIYLSRYEQGKYLKPEVLGPPIRTAGWEQAPSIAPDGSYIVFTGRMRPGEKDRSQYLYVSFHKPDDSWTVPNKLDLEYPGYHQGGRFSRISPDGKYLFFTKFAKNVDANKNKPFSRKWNHEILKDIGRYEYNDADVFWISTQVIETLKPEDLR